jgi:exopolysaccharide production protein ExoY
MSYTLPQDALATVESGTCRHDAIHARLAGERSTTVSKGPVLKARTHHATPDAQPAGPKGGRTKRALDIAIASVAGLALSPLIIVIALAVRLSMGGSVLYAHPRLGHGGRIFTCYKFRTMVANSEELLDRLIASRPDLAAQWRAGQKLDPDPRITPLGHVLRKTSLDELPQLWNVLRGEMSCVGPRPVVAGELARYGRSARHYLCVRPGLTGLWQVSGRSRVSYRRRIALDRFYVRSWSLWLDFRILLATIPAVMRTDQTG